MGRYYDIAIGTTRFTSYPNGPTGAFDPGALNVQLDLLASDSAIPMGNCTISIDGVPISMLRQPQVFAGMDITVRGGMGVGFPLANPTQAGLLLQGSIYQSFANWIGTDQNINFVVVPSVFTYSSPGNFVFIWQPGQTLANALSQTLSTAYQNKIVTVNISSNYSAKPPFTGGYYHTLADLAQFLKSYTAKSAPNGTGIVIKTMPDGSILVDDGSANPAPVNLNFTDLIGQPKWVDQNLAQFATVMRADVQIGSVVQMPKELQVTPGFWTTTAASLPSQLKYQTTFSGQLLIQSVRHVGNFRDSDGTAWVTVFQGAPIPTTTSIRRQA